MKIRKKVVPDLIFFTAQRSENISFIFSLVKTFSKYAFYFINDSLYFITLYIVFFFKLSYISRFITILGFIVDILFIPFQRLSRNLERIVPYHMLTPKNIQISSGKKKTV